MADRLLSDCFGLRTIYAELSVHGGPEGPQVQVGGGFIDPSHQILHQRDLDLWLCGGGPSSGRRRRPPAAPEAATPSSRQLLEPRTAAALLIVC